jgi:uncharacterized protein YlzI (FlbEa/FlbD family)
MPNDGPVFIKLTEVFNNLKGTAPARSRLTKINANNIDKMDEANPNAPFFSSTPTTVLTVSGVKYYIKETQDEVNQKIAEALKPKVSAKKAAPHALG